MSNNRHVPYIVLFIHDLTDLQQKHKSLLTTTTPTVGQPLLLLTSKPILVNPFTATVRYPVCHDFCTWYTCTRFWECKKKRNLSLFIWVLFWAFFPLKAEKKPTKTWWVISKLNIKTLAKALTKLSSWLQLWVTANKFAFCVWTSCTKLLHWNPCLTPFLPSQIEKLNKRKV